MKKIKVTPDNLKELSENVEVLEVLEYGVKILTSKNGVVMREEVASWENEVRIDNGIITNNIRLTKGWEAALPNDIVKSDNDELYIEVNLPKGVEETLNVVSDVELTEMTNKAMKEATKGKKTTKKKSE
jgi:hypothetical protein